MEILNASDARREFGDVLIKPQRGPVGINKNGKPVAVVISAAEFTELQALKEEYLKQAIQEGIADLHTGEVTDGKTVMDKLRKRVSGKEYPLL
ncbi:MAG: type II toxin-antitoxin system prevent-host-death family antitoxin [Gammaproteobacteria bacterium]|nr:type II toxin-antitoxin system prevent-host-death family antitoxin [Gammaproteobacteria bacterium]